jgi:hypothetical protein
MTKKATKGPCALCGKDYARAGMTRHLESCLKKGSGATGHPGKSQRFFLVLVTGRYATDYWMHLKVAAGTTLESLDDFLRDTWLECCGHMSAFMRRREEIGMNRKVDRIFTPGLELEHIYDFGSSTELRVKVVNAFMGPVTPRKPVEMLARNEAPMIPCDACGRMPAATICKECQWEGEGWLCSSCAETHECFVDGEASCLPVVNSPRTGTCAYTG